MNDWLRPGELFNPLTMTAAAPLTGWEVLAGPFGLLAFLPLVPLLRLLGRVHRRTALLVFGLLWLVGTVGPLATGVLLGGVCLGGAWVIGLGALRRRGRLGQRGMTALIWVGLHVLILPVWWFPSAAWYGWETSRLPVLHNIGLAYFLLRFLAWGMRLAKYPDEPLRLMDTICWLLYPPCMRLGPVLLRDAFLERLDAWEPRRRPPWWKVGRRLGSFLLGMVGVGVTIWHLPRAAVGTPSLFDSPEAFATKDLLVWFYLIPIQVYLLLWSYNQLAVGLSLWVGIRVDDNFHRLPGATSIREFWRRWHITVGTWLRDCVYIPLGGNRGVVWLNYVAVFGYVGLWHGPSWSFLAWGLLQAFALIVQRQWDRLRDRWGWPRRPGGPLWTLCCWLLTVHYAVATIIVFTDFDHLGTRLFAALAGRLAGG